MALVIIPSDDIMPLRTFAAPPAAFLTGVRPWVGADFGGSGGGGGDFSGMKGLDKPFKAGGKVSSASKRADGIAIRGRTRA